MGAAINTTEKLFHEDLLLQGGCEDSKFTEYPQSWSPMFLLCPLSNGNGLMIPLYGRISFLPRQKLNLLHALMQQQQLDVGHAEPSTPIFCLQSPFNTLPPFLIPHFCPPNTFRLLHDPRAINAQTQKMDSIQQQRSLRPCCSHFGYKGLLF